MNRKLSIRSICIVLLSAIASPGQDSAESLAATTTDARQLIETYCFICHDASSSEGGIQLDSFIDQDRFDGTLLFENLITERMPPADADQPSPGERQAILAWLAAHSTEYTPESQRRISRHEFVHSLNDLLAVRLDVANEIPDDRGTNAFDTDRQIKLSSEQLQAYFKASDLILDEALPLHGFPREKSWTTTMIKDSHETYNIYVREFNKGLLYSWTRANNGNAYSYFYDNFESPEQGSYELTFDAAKVGYFEGDVSILVYAGKYYYADDRPQTQRLLGVLSVGNHDVRPFILRGLLYPGESISVHCYSNHTWRQQGGNQGAYIERLNIRGPVLQNWPPDSMTSIFSGLPLEAPVRETEKIATQSNLLQQIGASISVSSYQPGMEKEKMLDRSSKTFWHTRFTPDVAPPPHYVILENPNLYSIAGLSYSTWTGGNGNGQVKAYSVSASDDGERWSLPLGEGKLEVLHAAAQDIRFTNTTNKRFIRFLVTDAVALDGKSLASIGGLEPILDSNEMVRQSVETGLKIAIGNESEDNLKGVIRRFAQRAFSTELTESEIAPYYQISLDTFRQHGDFLRATRAGLKAVLCSHRFLLSPGIHRNHSYRIAANLSRCLWLSVPDERLTSLAQTDSLNATMIQHEIDRMLQDPRAHRMIHSFCNQWLNLKDFNKVSPSLKLYPEYDDLLNHYLPQETEKYLHTAILSNLPISVLIDSEFLILNQRLAEHYGIQGIIGQELRPIALPPDSPRGGLLTMGSILKVTSDGFQTSPILRGAWISKNIAGNTLSPPPPNIKMIDSEISKRSTLKEKIEEHKRNSSCYGCHKSIDPYGFALENFDATGQWRAEYRSEVPHQGTFLYKREGYFDIQGNVDASGEIGETRFHDVMGLKRILLSNHKRIAYNFARKFFEYANGYEPNLSQRLDIYSMIENAADDCRLKDLISRILIYSMLGRQP